ncbi:MAG: hypothetical protein DMF04_12160 [Verrucomicrobia bacterium]|nr:MAG: hypothetical protein DMF04_12160 [Verrucomicrobiota bacterium]
MKNRDQILDRLLRAAKGAASDVEMPFGFDTRVLALARESAPNGSVIIALFARRAAILALAVIAFASVGVYRASISNTELPAEYAMADTAIQTNLGE